MTESSEGEQEGKLSRGNQPLVADDDICKMAKKAAWSVSSCKPGNGVVSLSDDNLYTYWQLKIAVLSNHLKGRDTRVRQIKVYGPRPNPIPQNLSVHF